MSDRLDEAALDEYTDRFDRDAFRYEILPAYDVASDRDELDRYRAGEPAVDPATVAPWGRWIAEQRARGATVRRLRVLLVPPSEYLRFECEWIYSANVAAGEKIRVLDLTEQAAPSGLPGEEFWMLDDERAAVMVYADDGRFLHADVLDAQAAAQLRAARDVAWSLAEPFTSWWQRHPEHHRPAAGLAGT